MRRLTGDKVRIIKMELEEALKYHGDFKAGGAVPWKFRPYLELLDERDCVGAYLNGTLARRAEYKTLRAFTTGTPAHELLMARNGNRPGEVSEWIEGFVEAMLERFLELNVFCPFCDRAPGSGSTASAYPLSGHSCPHRDLQWGDEEGES